MKSGTIGALGSILAAALVTAAGVAFAGNNPIDEKWWPSEFGPDDQAGATAYITPEKRIDAAKLVKQGKMQTSGHALQQPHAAGPGPTFALSIPGAPTHGPLNWPGDNFDHDLHGRAGDCRDRSGRHAVGWSRPPDDPHHRVSRV